MQKKLALISIVLIVIFILSSQSAYCAVSADEEAAIFKSAAVTGILIPEATGKTVYKNDVCVIDASNTSDGYIMINYFGKSTAQKILRITAPSGTNYDYIYTQSSASAYTTFTFAEGNGKYKIILYEMQGKKAAPINTASLDVKLANEFSPFLYPNYYVNFNGSSKAAKMAAYLTKNSKTDISRIENVYKYVVEGMKYDKNLAKTVQAGYVPDLERAITEKTGICFDYASLMTGMLRSLGIPTKMVFGYAGSEYHAWISTYTKESGWIMNVISFDGKTWKLMDPTFASTGGNSKKINDFIKNTDNYKVKYCY